MIRTFTYEGKDRIILPAQVGAFEKLSQWIFQISEEINLSQRTTGQLCIACDEIFTNIANYGYPQGNGVAEVSIALDTDAHCLQITFIDKGIPCNPLELSQTPDVTLPANERTPGGLGLFLVKNLMDEVTYRREDDKNILQLTKNFSV